MPAHLILRLDAPLMSFGGDMVDAFGVVRDFPARSMITGLIANALGWDRAQSNLHQALQNRIVMGSVRIREGQRIRDFQTAKLEASDKGWTTHGQPEGRAGGAATYNSPYIRYRDADADALVLVAFRLDPADIEPDLDAIAAALDRPERPLFIGRKPFVPSSPLVLGRVEAQNVMEALRAAIGLLPSRKPKEENEEQDDKPATPLPAQWPQGEGKTPQIRMEELTDERDWASGVHTGLRRVVTGHIIAETETGARA